jgi:putative transposase
MPVLKVHNFNEHKKHFVTFTSIEWIDIFTSFKYYEELLNILKFLMLNKGLEIYGYVFMMNHIHLIIGTKEDSNLSNVVQSFKSFSTKKIKELLESDNRKYIMGLIKTSRYKRSEFQIWQDYNYPEVIETESFFQSKLNYIHNNPVRKGYVLKPEEWLYSSARNYVLGDNSLIRISKPWE